MRVRRLTLALVLLVGLVSGGPARAGTPSEPDFVDPCGTAGIVSSPTDGVAPPWVDICGGWFETLSGSGGLKVTATFAGTIHDDRLGYYYAQWRAGDCEYRITHDRGLGRYEAPGGLFVADPGSDTLRIRCGQAVEEPCQPVGVGTCTEYAQVRHFPLTDAVTVGGTAMSWTLRFEGPLALLADELSRGTALSQPRLYAATKVVAGGTGPGVCSGTMCTNVGSDFAAGRAYTIGD